MTTQDRRRRFDAIKRAAGLVRFEVWIHPDGKGDLKKAAKKINKALATVPEDG